MSSTRCIFFKASLVIKNIQQIITVMFIAVRRLFMIFGFDYKYSEKQVGPILDLLINLPTSNIWSAVKQNTLIPKFNKPGENK